MRSGYPRKACTALWAGSSQRAGYRRAGGARGACRSRNRTGFDCRFIPWHAIRYRSGTKAPGTRRAHLGRNRAGIPVCKRTPGCHYRNEWKDNDDGVNRGNFKKPFCRCKGGRKHRHSVCVTGCTDDRKYCYSRRNQQLPAGNHRTVHAGCVCHFKYYAGPFKQASYDGLLCSRQGVCYKKPKARPGMRAEL